MPLSSNDLLGGSGTNPTNRARVGGSGFTVFTWQSAVIAFARQISHTSPQPVGPGATPIHPMDTRYSTEIITPAAAGPGSLVLELYELYGQEVWDRLSTLTGAVDIVDIFEKVANSPDPITMVKFVRPPNLRGKTVTPYTEEYHNCVVSQVMNGETIEVGTMEVLKQITVMYTHMTRGGQYSTELGSGSGAFANGPISFS
jgi:hypothetical protein